MSLKITLYKDCILTRDYKEAFNMRNASNIDTYLATLTKLDIYSGDDVYFTNSGTISVENTGLTAFTSDIYNYMVFESGASKRYCFIKNITLVNETAIIEYEEDIWSNYSGSLKLRYGTIQYAKRIEGIINPSPEKFLPKEYDGNQPLTLSTFSGLSSKYCYVIADISIYKIVSTNPPEFSTRISYSCLIGNTIQRLDSQDNPIGSPVSSYKWRVDNDTLRILSNIKIASSTQVVWPNIAGTTIPSSDTSWRYELMNIKLIPAGLGEDWFKSYTDTGLQKLFNTFGSWSGRYFETGLDYASVHPDVYILSYLGGDKYLNVAGLEGNLILTKSIIKAMTDFTVKGFINYSRAIPFTVNGLDMTVDFMFTCNAYCSSILLNINNEIIDVSNDFTLQLPLSVQSADITQQQAISRSLSDMQMAMGQVQTVYNGGMDVAKNIGTLNSIGFLNSWVGTGMNMTMQSINREALNAKQFATNKAISIQQKAVENCLIPYGFYLAKITPNNSADITNFINKFGYRYNDLYVVDSNVFDTTAYDQYVQFSSVAIYGSFSNDIADKLKQILLNGIYLFATSTV